MKRGTIGLKKIEEAKKGVEKCKKVWQSNVECDDDDEVDAPLQNLGKCARVDHCQHRRRERFDDHHSGVEQYFERNRENFVGNVEKHVGANAQNCDR